MFGAGAGAKVGIASGFDSRSCFLTALRCLMCICYLGWRASGVSSGRAVQSMAATALLNDIAGQREACDGEQKGAAGSNGGGEGKETCVYFLTGYEG